METHTANYEQLAEFVDALIAKKYPDKPEEELEAIREEAVADLADRIDSAVLDALDPDQLQEFNDLLDQDDEAAYDNFFTKHNLSLDKITEAAMTDYAKSFLGDLYGQE